MGTWFIPLFQLFFFLPAILILVLVIYALVLSIKALKIYIEKNR